MEKKSLYDISWQISEEEYRKDKALSYSTLAKFEREGFNGLDHLFDKIESPSLTFGSAVDAIITGGQEEFDSRFIVADFPKISDNLTTIINKLFKTYSEEYKTLDEIPDYSVSLIAKECNFWVADKWDLRRAKVVKGEEGTAEYYKLLYTAKDKIILSMNIYQDVINAVEALKNSKATSWYFAPNNPFENVERFYQLKFKTTFEGINYRCMFDELIVDHSNKTIQPIDLKTSYKKEWDFYKSFIEWNYQIQNRLYTRILQDIISKDDYFKNFIILPYKDIVVCKDSLTPLVWNCLFTFAKGTLYLGKDKQIIMRDPEEIGKELIYYLINEPEIPIGIKDENDLYEWINKI